MLEIQLIYAITLCCAESECTVSVFTVRALCFNLYGLLERPAARGQTEQPGQPSPLHEGLLPASDFLFPSASGRSHGMMRLHRYILKNQKQSFQLESHCFVSLTLICQQCLDAWSDDRMSDAANV